jgi:hypothetical protein
VDLEAALREFNRETKLLEDREFASGLRGKKKDGYTGANALNALNHDLESAKRSVNEAEGRVREASAS